MDKRLKLTTEQIKAVEQYNKSVEGLVKANVLCVHRSVVDPEAFEDLIAFNGNYVETVRFQEDWKKGEYMCDFDNPQFQTLLAPFGLSLTCSESNFSIRFKEE